MTVNSATNCFAHWTGRLSFTAALLLTICAQLRAQGVGSRHQSIKSSIEKLVTTQYGSYYKVAVDLIDSVLGTQECDDCGEITDPYGTLRHCVLFAGVRYFENQDSGFFGIYRDGRIIWESARIIDGVWATTFAVGDINKDGKVDILTTWFPNGDPRIEYMWIFSWDGEKGEIVNQTDSFGRSTISGANFTLVDLNSSGAKDISASSSSPEALITTFFHWNGTYYIQGREIEEPFDDDQTDH